MRDWAPAAMGVVAAPAPSLPHPIHTHYPHHPPPSCRFDGDGMIHAIKFSGGKASYCNRWVETSRLGQEEKAGWPLAVKSKCPPASASP